MNEAREWLGERKATALCGSATMPLNMPGRTSRPLPMLSVTAIRIPAIASMSATFRQPTRLGYMTWQQICGMNEASGTAQRELSIPIRLFIMRLLLASIWWATILGLKPTRWRRNILMMQAQRFAGYAARRIFQASRNGFSIIGCRWTSRLAWD